MQRINVPKIVQSYILDVLVGHGYQAYVVGGCVRDSLLGRVPHDWDICTNALPQAVISIFGKENTLPTGIKHGTVTVCFDENERYEITTFRTDGKYSDGRHPDNVQFVSELEEDLARRDFTINAMAYSDAAGIIDPFGGRKDLEAKLIRCVGRAEDRFEEDHLRMLRAIRFAAQFGFEIEDETAKAIMDLSSRVHLAAPERIGVEFFKTVTSPYAADVFRSPAGKQMLKVIVPMFREMDGCEQNNRYHCADVFEHTMMALENSWKCNEFPAKWADDEVRMAILLHDTGKPTAKTTDTDGHDHFYGHAAESGKIAEAVLKSLRYSNEFANTVTRLVAYHDVAFTPTKACARRMLNKFGEKDLYRLLKIRECDNRAHAAAALERFAERDLAMPAIIAEVLEEKSAFSLKQLDIDGYVLMSELGLQSGPMVGKVLDHLLEQVINEQTENKRPELLSEARVFVKRK